MGYPSKQKNKVQINEYFRWVGFGDKNKLNHHVFGAEAGGGYVIFPICAPFGHLSGGYVNKIPKNSAFLKPVISSFCSKGLYFISVIDVVWSKNFQNLRSLLADWCVYIPLDIFPFPMFSYRGISWKAR